MSFSWLSNMAAHLFRLIVPPPSPIDDFEYPNYSDKYGKPCRETVGHWKYTAAIGYQNPDQIAGSQVNEMWWYKNVDGLEHEYIMIACHRAGEVDVYLRLERRPPSSCSNLVVPARALPLAMIEQFEKAEFTAFQARVATEQKFVQKAVGTILERSTPRSKNTLVFVDSVTRLLSDKSFLGEEALLIAYYNDFKKSFSVRDLAFLADKVNAHAPQLDNQCIVQQSYWYTQTLVELVVAIYEPAMSPTPQFQAAGTHTVAKNVGFPPVAGGEDYQNTIYTIRKEFEDAIRVHDGQVQRRYYEREGRQLELEQQLQAEKQKRRELEERLAAVQRTTQTTNSGTS